MKNLRFVILCLCMTLAMNIKVVQAFGSLPADITKPCKLFGTKSKKALKVVDDQLVLDVLQNQLVWEKVKQSYSDSHIEKVKLVSEHSPTAKVYTATINEESDHLTYFVDEQKSFPVCVVISSQKSQLSSLKLVHRKLTYFQQKYNFSEEINLLVIGDIEGGNTIKLSFEQIANDGNTFTALAGFEPNKTQ